MSFDSDLQSINADFLGPDGLGKSAYLSDGTKIDILEVREYNNTFSGNPIENANIRVLMKTYDVKDNDLTHGDLITIETPSEMIDELIEIQMYRIKGIEPDGVGMTILILSKD